MLYTSTNFIPRKQSINIDIAFPSSLLQLSKVFLPPKRPRRFDSPLLVFYVIPLLVHSCTLFYVHDARFPFRLIKILRIDVFSYRKCGSAREQHDECHCTSVQTLRYRIQITKECQNVTYFPSRWKNDNRNGFLSRLQLTSYHGKKHSWLLYPRCYNYHKDNHSQYRNRT